MLFTLIEGKLHHVHVQKVMHLCIYIVHKRQPREIQRFVFFIMAG